MTHILVTTDFSPAAERAYTPVLDLARRLQGRVTVLHVVHDLLIVPTGAPFAPPQSSPTIDREFDQAQELMAKTIVALGKDVQVHGQVLRGGDIVETIVHYADQNNVDWLAISTHGRTGISRMILGSVAEAIVRHSHIPVLCFPKGR